MGEAARQKLTASDFSIHDTITIMTSDPYYGSELQKFLEERYARTTGHAREFSMTGMGAKKGSWFVSDADYPRFLDLMHDYLFVRKFRPNNFVEQRRPDGVTPLLIDLDFTYPAEKNLQRTFGAENIQGFVNELVHVLKEYFDIKDRATLRFFVTLRPQPYQSKGGTRKDIKDGIHIVCPDISLCSDFQAMIRHCMLEREAIKKSFEGTGYTNKDEVVFDKTLTAKQGWLFYGESKPDIPPYLLKFVFKFSPKTGKLTSESVDGYTPKDLMTLLSIRHTLAEQITVQEKKKEDVEGLLGRLRLASNPDPAVNGNQVVSVAAANEEIGGILATMINSIGQIVSTEDEIELAKRLVLECLSPTRADGYDDWMRVGWCLRNIDSKSLFETWMEFSAKSPKFKDNNIEQLRRDWDKGSLRHVNGSPGLRMGSLKMWAREDNPVRYQEIMDGDIISYITKAALTFRGGTHHHVAMMVWKLFHEEYKCVVEGRSADWFQFKDHTWNQVARGIPIKRAITDYIADKVDATRRALKPPTAENMDGDQYNEEQKKYSENIIKLLKMQENLYNANFKDSVMKEAEQLFYDAEFHKKINQNPYLLGCANGVLNLREPVFDEKGNPIRYKPTLKPGTASDYVTMRIGVNSETPLGIEYVPYDPADPIQQQIQEFFQKIFPDEELREYVLTLLSSCLEGANKEQCFYIITGSGANGKSKVIDLMTNTLGQYASSLSTTALTRKRPESGAANPDIISIKGARFIKTEEPDEGEPLNTARMKQFSGEDYVEARGLFKDQEKFKITGKIFLACNRKPPIHSMDGGTWRRIRVIDFPSKFLAPEDPLIDPSRHFYPRDNMLEEKLKLWRVPFFSLLVHYYETRYCVHGVRVPKCVLAASDDYKGNFDSFGKFIKARVRRDPQDEEPPTFNRFWKTYISWHNEENPTGKRLSQNELKIRLNEMYQVPVDGKTYKYLRLFDSDEDAEFHDKSKGEAN